jgi:hypothetical protein
VHCGNQNKTVDAKTYDIRKHIPWRYDILLMLRLQYTKGFNLILEYNHVTMLSKYLLSPTRSRGLLKKKMKLPLKFRSFCSWFIQGWSIRLGIHDCKMWNVADAGFYMTRNRAAKTCKNMHCNGEMSRKNKVLISRI